ncbi:serine-rich adhesin for platelets-like [Ruditapes philippinarum]|uniref:serine-rich adhesin for platelets-like n=1 Tax=Ruditapes philippinarum TaxID=129788 RepID=UPI00295B23EA|nr:serine-rich adhesin for platelets-like [Ruditapes philippinarum]
MLSLKVHIPLCLCKRKSNLSLSLVGYLWLLSMIAITVSDSLSDRTDLKTSVPKQQLGNVAPKNSLLDSSSFFSDYKSSATKKVETAEKKDSVIFSSSTRTTKPCFKKVTSTNEVQEASLSSKEIIIPKLPLLLGSRGETLSADIEIYSSLYNWDVTAQVMSNDVLSDTSMITPRSPFASNLATQTSSTFYQEEPREATDTSVTFVNINDETKPEMSQNMITTTSVNKDFTLKQFNINAGSSHTLISSFSDGSRESILKYSHEQISHTHDIPPSISHENRNSTKTHNSDQPVTYQRHISSNMSGTRKESKITETMFLITNTTEQSFSTSSVLPIESFESSVSATTHHSDPSTYISSPGDARTTDYMSSPSSMNLRPTTSGTRYNSGQQKSSARYETPLLPELPELQSSFNDNVYKTTHALNISSTENYETNTDNPHISYFNTDPLKSIPKETVLLPFNDLHETTIIVAKTISSVTEVLPQEKTSPIAFTSSFTVQSENELFTPDFLEHFHSESDQELSKLSSVIQVFRHEFSSSTSQESVTLSQQDTSQISQKDVLSDVSSVSLMSVESPLIEMQHILSSKNLNIDSQSIKILSSNSSANFETEGHIDMLSTRKSTSVDRKTLSCESTSIFKSIGREMSALFSKTTPGIETVLPSDFSYVQASKSLESELKMSYIETISLLNSKTSLLNGQISMDQKWLATPSILPLANTYRILPSFTEVLNVNEDQLKTLYTQSSIFTAYDIPVLSTEGNIKRVSRIKSIQSFSAVETLEQKELKSYEILKIYKPGISLRSTKLLSKQFLPDIYDNTFIPDTPKVSGSDKIESFSGILLTDTIVELPSIIEQLHSEQRRLDSVATNKISITPSFSSGHGTGISEQNKLESSTVLFKTMTIEMSPQLTEKGTKQHKHKSSSQLFESSVSETPSASTELKALDQSEWSSELFQSYVYETLSNIRKIKTPELGPSYKTIQYFTYDVTSRFTERKTQEQDQFESYSKLGQSPIHKTSPPISILKTSGQNIFTPSSETSGFNSFIEYSKAAVSDDDSFSSSILGVTISEPGPIKLSSYTLQTEADYLSPSFSDLKTSSQSYTVSLDTIWTYTKTLSLRERSSAKWFRTSEQRSSMLSGKSSSASDIKSGSSYSSLNDIQSYFDTHAILLTSNLNRFQTHLSITDIQSFSAIEKALLFSRTHDVSSTSVIYSSISSTNIFEIESTSGMSGHSQSSFTILSPFIVEENSSSSIINEDLTSSSINNVSNFSVSHQIPSSSTVINVFPQTSVMEAVMTSLGTDESPISSFINGISPSLFLNEIQTTAINDIPTSSIIKVENPTSSFINQFSSSSNIKQLSSSLINYENPSFSVIDEIISSSSKYENVIYSELTVSPDISDISSSSSIYQFLTSTVTNKITKFSRIYEFSSSSVIYSVHSFVITEIMPSSSINESPLPSVIHKVPSISVLKKSMDSSTISKNAYSVINDALSTSTSSSINESALPSVMYEVPTFSVIKKIMVSTSIIENETSLAINKISTSSTINVIPSFLSSVIYKISSSLSMDKIPSFPVTNEIQSSLSEKEFSLSSVIDRVQHFLVKTEIMPLSIMKESPLPSVIENVSPSLILNENTSSSNKNEFSISSLIKNDIIPSSGMDEFPSSPVINEIQSSLSTKKFALSSVMDSNQPSLVMTEIIVRSKTKDTGISSSNAISLKSSERVTLSSSQFLTTETHNEPTLPIEPRFIETSTIEMTSNKDVLHGVNTTKVSLSTKYADLDLSQHSSPTTTISDKTLITQHQTTIDTTVSVFSTYPTFTSSFALQDTVSEFPSISATPTEEKHTYTDKIEPSTFTHTRNIEIVSNSSLVTNYTEDFLLHSSMASPYKPLGDSFLNTVQIDTTAKTVLSFTKYKNSQMQNMSISSSREISVNESETELSIAGKHRSSSEIIDISMFSRVNAFIAEKKPHSPDSLDTISLYIEDVTTLSSEVTHMYYNKQSLDPHSTFLSLQSSSDAAVKLPSATFKSLSRSSDAQMKLSSAAFSPLQPSSDTTVKFSVSKFSSLPFTTDATLKLVSSTFTSVHPSSHAAVKLSSSTLSSLQPSSDEAVKFSTSTFTSLQSPSDATLKFSSATFTSLQQSTDSTVKLSSSTFSTWQPSLDGVLKLSSSTFSSLEPSYAAVKLSSSTLSSLQPTSDETLKLSSGTFSTLQPLSHATLKLSSSTFSSLLQTSGLTLELSSSTLLSLSLSSDAQVKSNPSTISSLQPSSDATLRLSSETFTSLQPSSDSTVTISSSTCSTLQPSLDASLESSSGTFTLLQQSTDATLELSSGTFTSLQPSSHAAVKLSSSTFSSLLQTADATLELSSSTFSPLLLLSDAQVKSNPLTISSLRPSSDAILKLSSSTFPTLQPSSLAAVQLSSLTFSSLLLSSDAQVKSNPSTISSLRPSSDATLKLGSSTFTSLQLSSVAAVKLSSSTFSTLQQSSDATLELSSSTFSPLQPSSDAEVRLTTFMSLSQSTDATVKLTSSKFSPLQPSSDAQVKLKSSTFSSLRLTTDVSLKFNSSTFLLSQPSSDAAVKLSSSTLSSLQSLSDAEVKISSAFTSLSRSSDVQVKLSSSTFSSMQPSSDTTVKLTSATFRLLSTDATVKLTSSNFSSLQALSDAAVKLSSAKISLLMLSSDAAVKLISSSFSTLQPSSDVRLKLSSSAFSYLPLGSNATIELSSSTTSSLLPSSDAQVILSSSTSSTVQPSSDAAVKLTSATFMSLSQSTDATVKLTSSKFSPLQPSSDATLELGSSTISPVQPLSDTAVRLTTFMSLSQSTDTTVKLTSSNFSPLQPSSDAQEKFSSSTFSSLRLTTDVSLKLSSSTFSLSQPSSDAAVKLNSSTLSSLQSLSDAEVKISSAFTSLSQSSDVQVKLSSSTFSTVKPSSDTTVKLTSATFMSLSTDATVKLTSSNCSSLQASSDAAVKSSSSKFSPLMLSSDAAVKFSSSTFSTLQPSSDAILKLSSSTISYMLQTVDTTLKLNSSSFLSLLLSSDAQVKSNPSTISSLRPSSDASLKLSSGTFTSLQPSSHAAVKLSSSTFSSLQPSSDGTLELSSSTFSSLLLSSDEQVKSSHSTISSLPPSSDATLELSSSTFSSLQPSSDATLELSFSTFSSFQPLSGAILKLSSSTFSPLLQTADAGVKLSSSTFTSLQQSSHVAVKFSSLTFSYLLPSSHAAVKLSTSTFSSLLPSSHASLKLSSSTFSSLQPSSSATLELSSSTYSSLLLSSYAAVKLSSSTFSSFQPSSDAILQLISSTFLSLLLLSDAQVKSNPSTISSLRPSSDATLKLSSGTFISLQPSSHATLELSSSTFPTLQPSSHAAMKLSSSTFSSLQPTSDATLKLSSATFSSLLQSSHAAVKLSSSTFLSLLLSSDAQVISNPLTISTLQPSSHSTVKLSSSTFLTLQPSSDATQELSSSTFSSLLLSSDAAVKLKSSTFSSLLQTEDATQELSPSTFLTLQPSSHAAVKLSSSTFSSLLQTADATLELSSSTVSSLLLSSDAQVKSNSSTISSLRPSSDATLKLRSGTFTSLQPSSDSTLKLISSTFSKLQPSSDASLENQYFTKEPSPKVSEETDNPQITTDTLVSMAKKDERTFKSDLSYTLLVLLSSKVSETSFSVYTFVSLTYEVTSALSQVMNSFTSTPSLIVRTEDLHLPDSRVQIRISPSKTVEINIDQSSKQSIMPSSRTLSSNGLQETTPLSSLRYQLSVSVTSELTLTSSSVRNENSFSSTKSKDVLQMSLSTHDQLLATTSTASSSILPFTVIETSTSILPLPRNIDKDLLLTVGIIVKVSVNIDSHAVNIQIKEGLQRCYIEGSLKADKDSNRKKRSSADAYLTVEIFGMERRESKPSHVDVDFYVLVDGIIQSPAEIVVIFSSLTIAETSAYMTFPVVTPVKLLSRNVLQTPTDADDSKISLVTIFLIGAPTICAFMATVLLISVYCRKGDNSFRKNWSSLHDADLKVDIEKGEVVSASVSRNKNIPNFSFDNGKDFDSDWTHIKPFLHSSKEFQKKEQSFKRSLSDMFSTSKRFDRLRNLGFHVSEVRKPDQPQSKEIREVTPNSIHEFKISREESLVDAIDALNVINDLDKATDSSRVTCSVEPLREVIEHYGYYDVTNESDRRTRSVTFQPKVRNSSSSAAEFYPNIRSPCNDSHVNINTAIDSLVYQSSDSYSDKNIQTKHSSTSKKIFSNRKRKKLKRRKKVKPDCLSNVNNSQLRNHLFESVQNQSPNSRPRVPSIPVEGYCNKIMFEPFYTSLTLGKEPLAVNNFIEGDIEDEVFFTDSFPLHNPNGKGGKEMIPKSIPASPETAHSLAASRYKRDQMKYLQKRGKSINKKEAVSRNNCDIIRNPLEVNSADTVKLEDNGGSNLCPSNSSSFQGSFLQDYVKHWSDDPFFLNTCFESYPDGSEFAGHEFESLNFNRDYTRSPSRDLHFEPIFPGETIQESNMAEMVVTETFPGMYEHVTKMGRVGKNHRDLHSAGPQFRKLPFQDQTFPMTQTSTPVSTPTPRKSEPVILKVSIKLFRRLTYLKVKSEYL